MRKYSRVLAVALAISAASVSNLFAQHFDVLIADDNGKLITGGYDDSNNTKVAPLRVFEGEAVPAGVGNPYESEAPGEPGFRAVTQADLNNTGDTGPPDFIPNMDHSGVYSALPANTNLSFDWLPITIGANTRNLFFWDGNGSVSFAPVAASYRLSLLKPGGGGYTETVDGGDASVIAGNLIQQTSGSGTVHTHLFTQIGNFNGVDFDAPAQGFYLYSLQMRMPGFDASDPAFFVFGALDPDSMSSGDFEAFEEAHELAAGWVEANLVPEPASAIMFIAAAVGCGAWRRRVQRNSRN